MASRMNSGGSIDLNRIKIDPRTGEKFSFNLDKVAATAWYGQEATEPILKWNQWSGYYSTRPLWPGTARSLDRINLDHTDLDRIDIHSFGYKDVCSHCLRFFFFGGGGGGGLETA